MLQALLELRAQVILLDVPESTQAWLWNHALLAADNGGYVVDPDPVTEYLGLPESLLARDKDGRWHFPGLRKRAKRKAKHAKYNSKRRSSNDQKSSNDQSAVDCTQSTSSIQSTVSNQLRPAGACARNIDILCGHEDGGRKTTSGRKTTEASSLFDDFDEIVPELVKEPPKRKVKPEPWHPVFDAVVEVTRADSRASTRSHVAKVAKDLHGCAPPYTAADVLALPAILEQQPWWKSSGGVLSIQVVQRHIGLVRAVRETAQPVGEEEYKSLDQLRIEALQSRRKKS